MLCSRAKTLCACVGQQFLPCPVNTKHVCWDVESEVRAMIGSLRNPVEALSEPRDCVGAVPELCRSCVAAVLRPYGSVCTTKLMSSDGAAPCTEARSSLDSPGDSGGRVRASRKIRHKFKNLRLERASSMNWMATSFGASGACRNNAVVCTGIPIIRAELLERLARVSVGRSRRRCARRRGVRHSQPGQIRAKESSLTAATESRDWLCSR
eukprot:6214837-Pleurochrysis_carterae.AAC.13